MKYLIFSDESGRWNEGEYYIRSWVKIAEEQYKLLRKEIIFLKHEYNLRELKWERFRDHHAEFKSIFDLEFKVFITISKPSHFEKRKYNIIEQLKDQELPIVGDRNLIAKIRERIIYAVKQELFFNFFEKQHIENSAKALLQGLNDNEYEYHIDNPQYKQWADIAKESGINNIEIIEKSEECPGIELADVICGCIKKLINNDQKAANIYKECEKSKMLDMYNQELPNPNLIFFSDFSEEEKEKLNVFR